MSCHREYQEGVMNNQVQCGKEDWPDHRRQKAKDNNNGEVGGELTDCLGTTNNEEEGTSKEGVLQDVQILKLNLDQSDCGVDENTYPFMGY